MRCPPVVQMKSTPGWQNRYWVSSCVGASMHWIAPGGMPAASAASTTIRTASVEQRIAFDEGRTIIALRVFAEAARARDRHGRSRT